MSTFCSVDILKFNILWLRPLYVRRSGHLKYKTQDTMYRYVRPDTIKDERLVIGIGHNRDLDRLLRLRSITIRCIDNRSTIIIAPITINLYVIIGIIGQNWCDYNRL